MLPRGLSPGRGKRRSPLKTALIFLVSLLLLSAWFVPRTVRVSKQRPVATGPLTQVHVDGGRGVGGRWYIPPSWMHHLGTRQLQYPLNSESSILDAAERALDLALRNKAFLNNTRIPLIAHQTWRSLDTDEWPNVVKESVEEWIDAAVGDDTPHQPEMAWFLWDDEGLDMLMRKYEPALYEEYAALPYPVEKADTFRVVVLKWFGGVYADVDCKLLKHPHEWVYESDMATWQESSSKSSHSHSLYRPSSSAYRIPSTAPKSYKSLFSSQKPTLNATLNVPTVNAIFGIEADNPPAPDSTHWRMGYTHPVQLTNWAAAMAPHHPVATEFLNTLQSTVISRYSTLRSIDPLDITGPPALTTAVQAVAQVNSPSLDWDALSGRNGDPKGGRGKIVAGDVLVLPITGFSPGRGWFQNMGSQSTRHPNARLLHAAAGSWRRVDFKVHFGKICRVTMGLCRDWKKIPDA